MSAPGTDTATYTPPDGDGIAVVTLDHFPVNSLSRNVTNGAAAPRSLSRVCSTIIYCLYSAALLT